MLALCVAAFAARDDERISRLQEQIQTLDGVVNATKNAGEQTRLEARLQRLRQELSILQDRQVIDARQRALADDSRGSPLDTLQDRLRAIDTTAEENEARIREISTRRKQVVSDREAVAARLEALRASPNRTPEREAELEEQLFTRNEELSALAYQREAVDLQTDLGNEAKALRERLKIVEASTRPNLRAMFEAYTRLRDEKKAGDQLGARSASLEQDLKLSQRSLDLAQQKLARYDDELALLEKQTGFFSTDKKVAQLLAAQRVQKQVLAERIPLIAAQLEAIKRAQQALQQRHELISLELAVLSDHLQRLKTGYWQRLRWPAVALTSLFILQVLAAFIFLPLAYKNEELLLARRLTRYVHVVVAAGVVAGFLFDDLSMVMGTMGIVSAALVISLQDVCTSIFGWFVIMMGNKFRMGDRLEIEGTCGDVIDIQLLRTTLLEVNGWMSTDQPTGRVLIIPNNFIFKSKVFNYNHGHPFIWGKIDVTVSFNNATEAAALFQKILEEETADEFEAARTAVVNFRRRYGVDDAVYQPCVHMAIAGNDVAFSLYYVSHYRKISSTRSSIQHRLIEELGKRPHLQLAVTTLQVVNGTPPPAAPSVVPAAAGSNGHGSGGVGTGTLVSTPPFAATATSSASRPPVWPN
jgi:small-conductance mechanosensitive channel